MKRIQPINILMKNMSSHAEIAMVLITGSASKFDAGGLMLHYDYIEEFIDQRITTKWSLFIESANEISRIYCEGIASTYKQRVWCNSFTRHPRLSKYAIKECYIFNLRPPQINTTNLLYTWSTRNKQLIQHVDHKIG